MTCIVIGIYDFSQDMEVVPSLLLVGTCNCRSTYYLGRYLCLSITSKCNVGYSIMDHR